MTRTRGERIYKGPDVDPVRSFFGSRPFSSGPEGFVVEDIDGCYVLRHWGKKWGTDAIGQIMLIEWKHRNPFTPADLDLAQSSTFRLLHDMMTASKDDRYCGFLVVTCNDLQPSHTSKVYVQRIPEGPIHGPMDADVFARRIETKWNRSNV